MGYLASGKERLLLLLVMMSVTCSNLDFGRARLDFAACGCSSSVSTRNFGKGLLKNVNWRRRFLGCRRVFSTKTPEAFLNGNFCFCSL